MSSAKSKLSINYYSSFINLKIFIENIKIYKHQFFFQKKKRELDQKEPETNQVRDQSKPLNIIDKLQLKIK
jgi:hypothetical protein